MNFTLSNFNTSKNLAIFDFDYTIINLNSNNYINKLLIQIDEQHDSKNYTPTPSIAKINKYKFPEEIEALSTQFNHTIRMQAAFKYVNEFYKLSEKSIKKCLAEIEINNSMKTVFKDLQSRNYELCIISDSNTLLIETILEANNLSDAFSGKIFANKGYFHANECIKVIPVNELLNENKTSFNCESNMCKPNICKRAILENILRINSVVNHVIYVGDGKIDFCPGLSLDKNDHFFVKKNLSLHKILNKSGMKEKFKANIRFWKNPIEIIDQLK